MDVTVLDRSAAHLAPKSSHNGIASLVGDALHIPCADRSFDVVGSSLFVHHLEPDEVIQFSNEALRVCRHAVIINDLRRNVLHLATAFAGIPLYRSRITRNDAIASVRRAYRPAELKEILAQTNAGKIEFSNYYLFRMGIVIWRKQAESR
jgi:ubiquinone/menaquinone biosynthesis C-methylase UbiE